jgi:type II secretory ATPase GspE/PulE/Tfp pilus assembly ATPase PilB-like protein
MLSELTGLASQRLVQILCRRCRVQTAPDPEVIRHLNRLGMASDGIVLFERGPGCRHCAGRGIISRLAVVEFIELTGPMKIAIERGDDRDLARLARAAGYVTMLEEALILMLRGDIAQSNIDRFPAVEAHELPIGHGDNANYLKRLRATIDEVRPKRTLEAAS